MTPLQSAYDTLAKASGIKVGDTVKVLRKAKNDEMGWNNTWDSGWTGGNGVSDSMDNCIGKTFKVSRLEGSAGITLEGTGYSFPFFVLEKMPAPKPAVPTEKKLLVHGAIVRLTYSFDTDRVVAHIDHAGYQFDDAALKEMAKEANKFLKQHRDANKAS